MLRNSAAVLLALCLLGAGLVRADSTQQEVVTNPPTALSATASSSLDANGCTVWTFSGKVSPKFRSEGGTSVKLVCTPYDCLGASTCSEPIFVFPQCTDGVSTAETSCGAAPVDSCGNFTFAVTTCASNPQLDPSYSCVFVVHTDVTKGSPSSCASGNQNQPPPGDPNGSAPCSGAFCPSAT